MTLKYRWIRWQDFWALVRAWWRLPANGRWAVEAFVLTLESCLAETNLSPKAVAWELQQVVPLDPNEAGGCGSAKLIDDMLDEVPRWVINKSQISNACVGPTCTVTWVVGA